MTAAHSALIQPNRKTLYPLRWRAVRLPGAGRLAAAGFLLSGFVAVLSAPRLRRSASIRLMTFRGDGFVGVCLAGNSARFFSRNMETSAVDLRERYSLGGGDRRVQRYRTGYERQLQVALPVGTRGHSILHATDTRCPSKKWVLRLTFLSRTSGARQKKLARCFSFVLRPPLHTLRFISSGSRGVPFRSREVSNHGDLPQATEVRS
jgi:hypothetical protein